jgi:hypothetical protein
VFITVIGIPIQFLVIAFPVPYAFTVIDVKDISVGLRNISRPGYKYAKNSVITIAVADIAATIGRIISLFIIISR